MYLLGFSLDNLSLMALTLSVGSVVDDAVVMLENIVRADGRRRRRDGSGAEGLRAKIGFTIISMTVSLVAVFIPVLFLSGILGRLFREFAITISVAILVSGFVSLSLTPMLCSRLLKAIGHRREEDRGTSPTVREGSSEKEDATGCPRSIQRGGKRLSGLRVAVGRLSLDSATSPRASRR